MKAKDILFTEEAKLKLLEGIDLLVDLVAPTFGPRGRNIGTQKPYKQVQIVKKGCHILADFAVKDPQIDMGVFLAKQAALKVKEIIGDGSTQTLLLIQAIVEEGIKKITSHTCPLSLIEGIEKGLTTVLKCLDEQSFSLSTQEKISFLHASADQSIASLLSQAFTEVGNTGYIKIEEGKTCESVLQITEGMPFFSGYIHAYFVTNKEKMLIEMHKPKILICDHKISSIQEILTLLHTFVGSNHNLCIIAKDINKDVLSTLLLNHCKELINICVIKAPEAGKDSEQILEDLAIFTNSALITEKKGLSLKNVTPEALGSCEKLLIKKDKSFFIKGAGKKKWIEKRKKEIDHQTKKESDESKKRKLEERKGRLQGKIAEIFVGAYSETELSYKKNLFEQSLDSIWAAMSGGVCIGGGLAYYQAAKTLDISLPSEQMQGIEILQKALIAPLKKLIENTGMCPSLVIEQIRLQEKNFGFNVLTEQIEDLYQQKIYDPVEVIKTSLIYAVSTAKTILLTETLLCDVKDL